MSGAIFSAFPRVLERVKLMVFTDKTVFEHIRADERCYAVRDRGSATRNSSMRRGRSKVDLRVYLPLGAGRPLAVQFLEIRQEAPFCESK